MRLGASVRPLVEVYDAALYDLDGVLYLGGDPVPHAADSVRAARSAGMRAAYVTNNASRRPAPVAAHLTELGIPATPEDVVTSAQAAVRWLVGRVPAGSRVLVVGSDDLVAEVADGGLEPVRTAAAEPVAVVQGLSPDTGWRDLSEAAIAVRAGALWVAGNTDATYPSPRGPLPGNGAMVAALVTATGRTPVVVGKPEPELHRESVERVGARRPLVVGDRLDTDVLGAVRGGSDSLLVLTGVTDLEDLLAAPPGRRPTYVSADLRGLLRAHPPVEVAEEPGTATCGAARARWAGDRIVVAAGEQERPLDVDLVAGDGPASGDEVLRAACALSWARHDAAVRS